MQSLLCCPVCSQALKIENRTYRCPVGHCFDMAKEGYVNLLPSNKGTANSGDDRQMVASRTLFLDKGYYGVLRDKICRIISGFETGCESLLDSGCGEGYYTSSYAEIAGQTVGIDISKNAIKHAAKRCKNAEFAVASAYHLPLCDSSVDVIINCFSPNAPEEFSRVLKKGGHLIYVVPAPRHLWELKRVLYDNPYENEEKLEQYHGFELENVTRVSNNFTLETSEEIKALFHMTPYTWTTPKDGTRRLESLEKLTVSAEFDIHIFRCR